MKREKERERKMVREKNRERGREREEEREIYIFIYSFIIHAYMYTYTNIYIKRERGTKRDEENYETHLKHWISKMICSEWFLHSICGLGWREKEAGEDWYSVSENVSCVILSQL